VDWARIYLVLAKDCGITWPEVGHLEQFMVVVYYEQALYDRALTAYEREGAVGF
jgi:hypothetical protein